MNTFGSQHGGGAADHAERHHWINAVVGLLDRAFLFDDTEQLFVIDIVGRLLDHLNIPDRAVPASLPAPVALETRSGFYTVALGGAAEQPGVRPARSVEAGDVAASVDAWRHALLAMLMAAYPDLHVHERMVAAAVLDDLLVAIGLPERAATCHPDEMVAAVRGGMRAATADRFTVGLSAGGWGEGDAVSGERAGAGVVPV